MAKAPKKPTDNPYHRIISEAAHHMGWDDEDMLLVTTRFIKKLSDTYEVEAKVFFEEFLREQIERQQCGEALADDDFVKEKETTVAKKKKGDEDTRSVLQIQCDAQTEVLQKTLTDVEDVVGNLRGALKLPTAILPTANSKLERAVFDDPARCPKCHSDDTNDKNECDGDPDEQTFRSHCNACGLEWLVIYQMKGVTILE